MSEDDKALVAAVSALERGNAQRALEHLSGVQQVSAGAWHLRAVALRSMNDVEGTSVAIRRGLSLEPSNPGLLLLHAEVAEETLGPQAAEEAYLALLRSHPGSVSGLLGYGWLLSTNGDNEGAKEVLERIPGHVRDEVPDVFALQGMIACSDGRIKESRELLDSGLNADPTSVRLHALRALLASSGNESVKKTSQHLHSAAAINPRQAAALGYQARYLQHWSMAPIRLLSRFGTAQMWVAWIVFIFTLRAVWPEGPIGWIVLAYLLLAVYSWVAPPLLRRWLRRKGEL